jgi:hypothetical protein
MPAFWVVCKVLFSGMQMLENYTRCQCACGMTPILLSARLHATCLKSVFFFIKPPKIATNVFVSLWIKSGS